VFREYAISLVLIIALQELWNQRENVEANTLPSLTTLDFLPRDAMHSAKPRTMLS